MNNVRLNGIKVSGFDGPLVSTDNVQGTGWDHPTAK
jgi:hypothetical protein